MSRSFADGSFQDYFVNGATVKDVLLKADLSRRHVIKLHNPAPPPLTPVDDSALWVDSLQF